MKGEGGKAEAHKREEEGAIRVGGRSYAEYGGGNTVLVL